MISSCMVPLPRESQAMVPKSPPMDPAVTNLEIRTPQSPASYLAHGGLQPNFESKAGYPGHELGEQHKIPPGGAHVPTPDDMVDAVTKGSLKDAVEDGPGEDSYSVRIKV